MSKSRHGCEATEYPTELCMVPHLSKNHVKIICGVEVDLQKFLWNMVVTYRISKPCFSLSRWIRLYRSPHKLILLHTIDCKKRVLFSGFIPQASKVAVQWRIFLESSFGSCKLVFSLGFIFSNKDKTLHALQINQPQNTNFENYPIISNRYPII